MLIDQPERPSPAAAHHGPTSGPDGVSAWAVPCTVHRAACLEFGHQGLLDAATGLLAAMAYLLALLAGVWLLFPGLG